MSDDYKVYLSDILRSIDKVERYTKGLTYKEFIKNDLIVDGVVRNLEIIGEAVKHIRLSMRKEYPLIEWKKIAGLRDILIHLYSGVNLQIIWDIVVNKVPELKEALKQIK